MKVYLKGKQISVTIVAHCRRNRIDGMTSARRSTLEVVVSPPLRSVPVAKTIERGSPVDTVPQTFAVRVLLISHLPLIRASLQFVLEQAGFTVVGEAAAFEDAF